MMYNKNLHSIAVITFLIGAVVPIPVSAHHSFATHYDSQNVIEISGTLSGVKMRSPHSFFEVDVMTADGTTETWEVEAHAVPILRRLGIDRDTLKVGDDVRIRGPRSRRPEKLLLFGAEINTSRGEQFEMLNSIRRPPDTRVSDERDDVTGVDRLTGTWMTFISGQRVADSPMPLNTVGVDARKNFNARVNSSSECVTPNLPSLLMIPYAYEITNYRDTITIFHEYGRVSRQVRLGSDQANVTDPQYGSRTGRFEDNTLIIDTTGFPEMPAGLASGWDPNGNGADIPSSANKTLTERYTVNEDGSQLILNYTVSDPDYLTRPFTDEIVWYRMPDDSPIYEFDCDAEIASRSTQNAVEVQ